MYAAHSLVRNLRNPNGTLYPAEDEWWQYYGLLPETITSWPSASVGAPEGLNQSNPLVAYFYGDGTGASPPDEKDRKDNIPLRAFFGALPPDTPLEAWDLGKQQRGGITTADLTDYTYAPALFVARLLDTFNAPGTNTLSWQHKTAGGKIDTATAQFIRENGEQWNQMRTQFLNEWRGTDDEREDAGDWDPEQLSVDYDLMLAGQYFLAPAYAEATGSAGVIQTRYPLFEWDDDAAADTYGVYTKPDTSEVTQISNHTGFDFAGVIVVGENLTEEKRVQIEIDGVAVETITVDGTTNEVAVWWPVSHTGALKVKLLDAISGTEDIFCEVAELLDFKADLVDIYAVIRCATMRSSSPSIYRGKIVSDAKTISDNYFANGCIVNGVAGAFIQESNIAKFPPYQAMRDFLIDHFRVIQYGRLKGYYVNGSGNSVLVFDRRGIGSSDADIFQNLCPRVDSSGDPEAVTQIRPDVLYKVDVAGASPSGTIAYNGTDYAQGETFRGTEVQDFDLTNATDLGVFEESFLIDIDDIPRTGRSNEWIFSIGGATVYRDSASSAYKPSAYADYQGAFNDRCHTFSTAWASDTGTVAGKVMNKYGGYLPAPTSVVTRTETPAGHRYEGDDTPYFSNTGNANPLIIAADGASQADCRDSIFLEGDVDLVGDGDCDGISQHYASCKVFKAPYRIKSIAIATTAHQVELELDGRLERNDSAPATVANTSASRSDYILDDVEGRSDENTVVGLLYYTLDGSHDPPRIGDVSANATSPDFSTSAVDGAVLCRFFLQKLIPHVYDDSNTTVESKIDTKPIARFWQYIEFVIRASVGGFLDEQSVVDSLTYYETGGGPSGVSSFCDDLDSRDYTMPKVMDHIGSTDDRFCLRLGGLDRGGHGPLPSTCMIDDQYNEVAKVLNLLKSSRFGVPIYLESRRITYGEWVPATITHLNGFSYVSQGWVEPTTVVSTGAWGQDFLPFQDNADAYMDLRLNGGNIEVWMHRSNVEWRARPHPKVLEAVPDALRAYVDSLGVGVPIVYQPNTTETANLIKTPEPGDTLADISEVVPVATPDEVCQIGQSGTLVAGSPPGGWIISETANITATSGTGDRPSAFVGMGIEALTEGYVRVPVL